MTNFALENKRDGFFHVFESIGIWCNGNTTDSGPVILGSSPSIPTNKKGVCQNSHPLLKYHKARTFTSSGFAIP